MTLREEYDILIKIVEDRFQKLVRKKYPKMPNKFYIIRKNKIIECTVSLAIWNSPMVIEDFEIHRLTQKLLNLLIDPQLDEDEMWWGYTYMSKGKKEHSFISGRALKQSLSYNQCENIINQLK